ncbi:MAG: hypothetical protein ACI4SF_06870 [Oscillospiraceae bacterium]
MGFQSVLFVITPHELKEALAPFTLFIGNAHVPSDYTHTPTETFIENYTALYEKLCSGEKIDYKKDGKMLARFSITTEIETVRFGRKHIYQGKEYKTYIDTDRGYAPYFSPFTFSVFEENGKLNVGTRSSWQVEYTDIMGFQLNYLKLTSSEADSFNTTCEKDRDSYYDYKLFKDLITKHTSALTFAINGTKKKTQIRISSEAKKKLPDFYCIKKYCITTV